MSKVVHFPGSDCVILVNDNNNTFTLTIKDAAIEFPNPDMITASPTTAWEQFTAEPPQEYIIVSPQQAIAKGTMINFRVDPKYGKSPVEVITALTKSAAEAIDAKDKAIKERNDLEQEMKFLRRVVANEWADDYPTQAEFIKFGMKAAVEMIERASAEVKDSIADVDLNITEQSIVDVVSLTLDRVAKEISDEANKR